MTNVSSYEKEGNKQDSSVVHASSKTINENFETPGSIHASHNK